MTTQPLNMTIFAAPWYFTALQYVQKAKLNASTFINISQFSSLRFSIDKKFGLTEARLKQCYADWSYYLLSPEPNFLDRANEKSEAKLTVLSSLLLDCPCSSTISGYQWLWFIGLRWSARGNAFKKKMDLGSLLTQVRFSSSNWWKLWIDLRSLCFGAVDAKGTELYRTASSSQQPGSMPG